MKKSYGILMYRTIASEVEFLLVHPGGPFFKNKDLGSWTVPKGEGTADEEPLQSAIREFQEETGHKPEGSFQALQPVRQKGGKQIYCWAVEGDLDPDTLISNTFPLEWPPRSGKIMMVPEIDRAAWFALAEARRKINERQVAFLEELIILLR